MKKKTEPAIIGKAYPTGGGGWRCFDGEKWQGCDKHGRILDAKTNRR